MRWTATRVAPARARGRASRPAPRAAGAILVEVRAMPNAGKYTQSELDVLHYALKDDLAAYLAEYARGAPVKTLADVIAFNERNKAKEMPYFGHELFVQAQAKGGLA